MNKMRFPRWLLLIALIPALHAEVYLKPNHPDAIALLPPPPAANSPEQAADHDTSVRVVGSHTDQDWAVARTEINLTIFAFQSAIGPGFQAGKFPKLEALFHEVEAETKNATNPAKDKWKRLRPYQVDPAIVPIAPENSFSYPSGHSTRGTVYALLLAEIFPEKRDAILEVGRNIGWHRVLGGDHFVTDIYAGRVLGQAIAHEFLANAKFKVDLAAAMAEVRAGMTQQLASAPK